MNNSAGVVVWVSSSCPEGQAVAEVLKKSLIRYGLYVVLLIETEMQTTCSVSFEEHLSCIIKILCAQNGVVIVSAAESSSRNIRGLKYNFFDAIVSVENVLLEKKIDREKGSDSVLIHTWSMENFSKDEIAGNIIDQLKVYGQLPTPSVPESTTLVLRTLKKDLAEQIRKNKNNERNFLHVVRGHLNTIQDLTSKNNKFISEAKEHKRRYEVLVDHLSQGDNDSNLKKSPENHFQGDTAPFFSGSHTWNEHFKLAKELIVSGKFNLAQKQLVAADLLNIGEPDLLAWYEAANAEQYRCLSAPLHRDLASCNNKYSFYISPSGRAGAAFIPNFLSLHPHLHAPSFLVSDKYGTMKGLEDYLVISNERFNKGGIQFGYNDHGHRAWKAGSISHLFKDETFIQFVRDPISSLKSSLTHSNSIVSNEEQFALVSPIWKKKIYIDFSEIDNFNADSLSYDDTNIKPPKPERTIAFFARLRLYYQQGFECSTQFPKWEVFDAAEFMPDTINIGMPKLLSVIGAQSDYFHPIYQRLCYSGVNHCLMFNSINIKFNSQNISFFLDYAGNTMFSDLNDKCEVAYTDPDDLLLDLGLSEHRLALCCCHKDWFALPAEERKRFVNDGWGDKILRKVMIPTWANTYQVWKKNPYVQPVKEISKEIRREFGSIIAEDTKLFLDRFGDRCIDWDTDFLL